MDAEHVEAGHVEAGNVEAGHMEAGHMELVLMLRGETRHCGDCGTSTVFLPVEEHSWTCTACDAAVVLADPGQGWVSAA